MNFYIITLGCKVNQYESEMMRELLVQHGFETTESFETADICIVNSCTVTSTGDSKCRKYIHRIRRGNPQCIIVLCGCMPQAFSDDTEMFQGCDIVLGNTSRRDIVPALEEYFTERKPLIRISAHEKGEKFEQMQVRDFSSRTRAYIKIEDGCNRFCSYCIIPYARGRVRSKSLDVLKKEAEDLALHGYREVVLVGINLSAYGEEFGTDIRDAVRTVCEIEGIERVRLGSIEPERMTKDVLRDLANEPKFCPHFHLSLQSGCDETLLRMRRHYTSNEYKKIVDNIRNIFDNPSITTDVMVGFVGESEEEFKQSLDFCDEIGFAKTHVFPYSRRKGTRADLMDGHVPEHQKTERSKIMIEHMLLKERAFMISQVGMTSPVLFETKNKNGMYEGYTPNYTKVFVTSETPLNGWILDVNITEAHDDYCVGELTK